MAGYSEDELIEQPTIALFGELGWETANCFHEFEQAGGSPLGRETACEVVLVQRLRKALERLNPKALPEAITQAIEDITRDRSRMSPAAANQEIYRLLKDGVKVKALTPARSRRGDEETVQTVKVIDWNAPVNNDFFLASQFWVTGELYTRRADLVGFVNGLPLVFVELKAAHKSIESAFRNNLRDYKATIPQFFWYNALIILSNGSQSRIGGCGSDHRGASPGGEREESPAAAPGRSSLCLHADPEVRRRQGRTLPGGLAAVGHHRHHR